MKVKFRLITPLVSWPLMLQLPVSGQTKIRRRSRSELFFLVSVSLVSVSFKYGCSSASDGSERASLKKGKVGLQEHSVGSMLSDWKFLTSPELSPEPLATRNMKKSRRPTG